MSETMVNGSSFFDALNRVKQAQQELYEEYPELTALTKRELEIFGSLLSNHTLKEIAEEKEISESSVLYHCKNIYRKLSISNRKQLLMKYKNLYQS